MSICDKCKKRHGCRTICEARAIEKNAREREKKERAILKGYSYEKSRRLHSGCGRRKRK